MEWKRPGWASHSGTIALGKGATANDPGARQLVLERVARYCWAYDERRADLLEDCFTEDGVWEGNVLDKVPIGPFATRSAILRNGGPALYLQSSALMLYPPWWIRDHPALVTITEEAARARVPDPEILLARIAAILRHDRLADLHRVTAPTLAIGARDDMVAPAHLSEALGRLVGGAETLILPDGGHFFPITRADRFVRAVAGFLEG